MKTLRRFIIVNMAILFAVAIVIAFNPRLPFPVKYAVGPYAQDLSRVHLLAITIAGLAVALLAQSALSLVGELRRLAFWLGLAYGLIALMVFFEQVAFGGDWAGWLLMVLLLASAAAFVWMGRRPLRPEEATAEIAALKIPDEVRRGLLRQIEESAAQEERNRLARDLHDSIKQQLFSINVGTAAAQERWESDPEGARKALAEVRRSAHEAMVEMQAMLHQLRPEALGTAGLIEALREQCEALGYRTGAEVTLEIGEPVPDDRMPPGAQDALFRIGQEMLANVARHARAQHVRLWLGRQDEEVMLRIVDDGQGFDPGAEVSGMGLRNLKERTASLRGRLEVASTRGSGAGLTVRIPLVSPPQPVQVEGGRRVLSEFLALSAAAWLVCSPLWTGAGAEGASDGSNYAYAPWTFEVAGALVLLLLATAAWWTGRSSPRNVRSLVNRKFEILLALFVGDWWLRFAPDLEAPTAFKLWALPAAAFLFAAGALVWVHRVSEVRRVWRQGARFWLLPLLPVVLVIALSVAWIFDRPGPLTVRAADAFFLAIGFAFPYLVSRRPRLEGASS
jgi:signal transduction histidine kinase